MSSSKRGKPSRAAHREAASGRLKVARRPALVRLVERPPLVYLGPEALAALDRGVGLLLGAKRPGWVDALGFKPAPRASMMARVNQRFDVRTEFEPVGLVLTRQELHDSRQALARQLAPGDVVVVAGQRGRASAYVNLGDRLAPAALKLSRARPATSARPSRPSRHSRSYK